MNNYFASLPHEVLLIIYDHLPLIYKIIFAKSNKWTYNCVNKYVDPHVRNINAEVMSRGGIAVEYAIKYGGTVVGNFLLDCLFGTCHAGYISILFSIGIENYDVDLHQLSYIPDIARPYMLWKNALRESGAEHVEWYVKLYNALNEIVCVTIRYKLNGKLINVIVCEPDLPPAFFIGNCALDFYKILFNSRGMILLMPTSVIRKRSKLVKTSRNIITRRHFILENRYQECSPDEIYERYSAQGFIIDNYPT